MLTSGKLCESVAGALGIEFATTREHLRNIRRAKKITFKGHGRGAAAMTTLDATRLLITAAGSSFVKDSVATLESFRKLLPPGAGRIIPYGDTTVEIRPKITLEDYLARVMQNIIDEKDQLADAYRQPVNPAEPSAFIALTLMSVVSAEPSDFPRVAIVRQYRERKRFHLTFASPKLSKPIENEGDYAAQVPGAGLLQTRDVPAWALAKIAHSL